MKFFAFLIFFFSFFIKASAQGDSTHKTIKGFISSITAYPNPFITTLKLKIVTCVSGSVIIILRDQQGKTVIKLTPFVLQGSSEITIPNVANLTNGIYVLTVIQNGIIQTIRLMK